MLDQASRRPSGCVHEATGAAGACTGTMAAAMAVAMAPCAPGAEITQHYSCCKDSSIRIHGSCPCTMSDGPRLTNPQFS